MSTVCLFASMRMFGTLKGANLPVTTAPLECLKDSSTPVRIASERCDSPQLLVDRCYKLLSLVGEYLQIQRCSFFFFIQVLVA